MTLKKETAYKRDPGGLLTSGSKSQDQYTQFSVFVQVRRLLKALIVTLAIRGMIPIKWADHLIGRGLKHD